MQNTHTSGGGFGFGERGGFSGAVTNQSLLHGARRQREFVQAQRSIGQLDEDVSQAEFDFLAGIGNLVAQPACGACTLRKGIALGHGELRIEGFEVHGDSLPTGNQMSTPAGKLPGGNFPAMDVFSRRQANLRELLKTMSAADLARHSKVAASYISRALLDEGEDHHKRIGEVTARKLEIGARKPSGWLDVEHDAVLRPPGPPAAPGPTFSDRHEVSESDWALLQDIRTVFSPEELQSIRARAKAAQDRALAIIGDRRPK